MSIEAMTAVLHHSTLTGTPKLVLLGIANHDGDGGAWPSISTLAKYANVEPRTVQRAIDVVVEAGEVAVTLNDGGTHRTPNHARPNLYRVLVRCPPTCDGSLQHRPREGVTPTSGGDASATGGVTPTSGGGVTPTSPEPSWEPTGNARGGVGLSATDRARAEQPCTIHLTPQPCRRCALDRQIEQAPPRPTPKPTADVARGAAAARAALAARRPQAPSTPVDNRQETAK